VRQWWSAWWVVDKKIRHKFVVGLVFLIFSPADVDLLASREASGATTCVRTFAGEHYPFS
jgi:hypothetical protein